MPVSWAVPQGPAGESGNQSALDDLSPGGHHITLSTPEDLPDVIADAEFLTMGDTLRCEETRSDRTVHKLWMTCAENPRS